jgi:hypothetical protein
VGRRLNRVAGIVAEVEVSASSCLLYRLPPFRTERGRMGHPSVMFHLKLQGGTTRRDCFPGSIGWVLGYTSVDARVYIWARCW